MGCGDTSSRRSMPSYSGDASIKIAPEVSVSKLKALPEKYNGKNVTISCDRIVASGFPTCHSENYDLYINIDERSMVDVHALHLFERCNWAKCSYCLNGTVKLHGNGLLEIVKASLVRKGPSGCYPQIDPLW